MRYWLFTDKKLLLDHISFRITNLFLTSKRPCPFAPICNTIDNHFKVFSDLCWRKCRRLRNEQIQEDADIAFALYSMIEPSNTTDEKMVILDVMSGIEPFSAYPDSKRRNQTQRVLQEATTDDHYSYH